MDDLCVSSLVPSVAATFLPFYFPPNFPVTPLNFSSAPPAARCRQVTPPPRPTRPAPLHPSCFLRRSAVVFLVRTVTHAHAELLTALLRSLKTHKA